MKQRKESNAISKTEGTNTLRLLLCLPLNLQDGGDVLVVSSVFFLLFSASLPFFLSASSVNPRLYLDPFQCRTFSFFFLFFFSLCLVSSPIPWSFCSPFPLAFLLLNFAFNRTTLTTLSNARSTVEQC